MIFDGTAINKVKDKPLHKVRTPSCFATVLNPWNVEYIRVQDLADWQYLSCIQNNSGAISTGTFCFGKLCSGKCNWQHGCSCGRILCCWILILMTSNGVTTSDVTSEPEQALIILWEKEMFSSAIYSIVFSFWYNTDNSSRKKNRATIIQLLSLFQINWENRNVIYNKRKRNKICGFKKKVCYIIHLNDKYKLKNY